MKKLLLILMTACLTLVLTACGNEAKTSEVQPQTSSAKTAEAAQPSSTPSNKTLIVYFSRTGNTELMANLIQRQTGGDMVRLEPEIAYPTDYDACVQLAKEELAANARPAVRTKINNMADYETVFIGYPNWWGTMPMMLFTFLEEYDFSNKRIIPFSTSGGSGLGQGPNDIKALCPTAALADGLTIRGNAVATEQAKTQVTEWLSGLGF